MLTILFAWSKRGCEAQFIVNRLPKMRFRTHDSSVAKKVQDLWPNKIGKPDKTKDGLDFTVKYTKKVRTLWPNEAEGA